MQLNITNMAKIKYCHYCAADTTFQVNRCGRCKKANTHKNNNSRWDRVKLKELKSLHDNSRNNEYN